MIKALIKVDEDGEGKKNLVLLGLTHNNLDRLRKGEAIQFNMDEHLPDIDRDLPIKIFLFADTTVEKMHEELKKRFHIQKTIDPPA